MRFGYISGWHAGDVGGNLLKCDAETMRPGQFTDPH